MQVRAGHPPGRADLTELHSPGNFLAWLRIDLAQMTVQADETLTVVDDHGIAIEGEIAGGRDNASQRRRNWRAAHSSDVHAFMR